MEKIRVMSIQIRAGRGKRSMGKGDRPGVKGQMGQKGVAQKEKDERGAAANSFGLSLSPQKDGHG